MSLGWEVRVGESVGFEFGHDIMCFDWVMGYPFNLNQPDPIALLKTLSQVFFYAIGNYIV